MASVPLPTFFFSYARMDEGNEVSPLLQRFFADLQDTLERRTVEKPAGAKLGTHDQWIGLSKDWDSTLSSALKSHKALVAIATPTYFSRDNCGKEIAVFAMRDREVHIDEEGALRNVKNVLPIRWYEDAAYEHNRIKDAIVHPILRKINWLPAQNDHSDRAKAIKRYRDKGMERCIKPGRDYYSELLTAFAQSIREMPELAEAAFDVAWVKIDSAFAPGWALRRRGNGNGSGSGPGSAPAPTPTAAPAVANAALKIVPTPVAEPSGPGDVAVFYLTSRPLFTEPSTAAFADTLVDEPVWRRASGPIRNEPYLRIVQAVQKACRQERLNDFHFACNPQLPSTSAALLGQLEALTRRNVIVALMVDPSVWFGFETELATTRAVIDDLAGSGRWQGPMLLPLIDEEDGGQRVSALLRTKVLRRDVSLLPQDLDRLVDAVQSQLIFDRGRITRASRSRLRGDGERPPVLHSPGEARA